MSAIPPASARTATLSAPLAALFTRLLAESTQAESSEWDSTETYLDADVYSAPAIHRREIDRVFKRLPLCLGHADQLRESGSMIARDLFGMPLLIVRDRESEIQVLLNVCRHRGARLVAEQEVVCARSNLICPYHAWTYDLNGKLRGIPVAQGFPGLDLDQRGLRKLPCQVRHGLIWAILDPMAEAFDLPGFLGGIDDDLRALDLASHRFFRQRVQRRSTNWKLVMDAFQEVYHIRRLHARTIAPFFLDAKSAGEGEGLHTRILVGRERLDEARDLAPEHWDVRQHTTLTHAIFPNTLIVYHPDFTSHMGMYPSAPGETLFVHTMFTPHEARNAKEQAHWERSFDLIDGGVFSSEDLWVSEQIQSVVDSGANQTFVLGRFEQHLRRFHSNLKTLLSD